MNGDKEKTVVKSGRYVIHVSAPGSTKNAQTIEK